MQNRKHSLPFQQAASHLTQRRARPPITREPLPARPPLVEMWPTGLKFNSCSQVQMTARPHLTGRWPKQVFAYTGLKLPTELESLVTSGVFPAPLTSWFCPIAENNSRESRLQKITCRLCNTASVEQLLSVYSTQTVFSACQKTGQL